jgi:hypothetical protein
MNLGRGRLQRPAHFAASLVGQLVFDQANEIVLLPFPEKLTRANFDLADAALAMFTAQRGSVDTIIDFSNAREDVDTSVIVARAYAPWPAGDKRHIFIVSSDVMEGVFRMYAFHHAAAGLGTTHVVRSLDGALAALGTTNGVFDPIGSSSGLQAWPGA